jgi:hypothetical protein
MTQEEDRARPKMVPQAFEKAQSALENAMAEACHPSGSGDPESPGATSVPFAPLHAWAPACAGKMNDEVDHRQAQRVAPQAGSHATRRFRMSGCWLRGYQTDLRQLENLSL